LLQSERTICIILIIQICCTSTKGASLRHPTRWRSRLNQYEHTSYTTMHTQKWQTRDSA